MKILCPISSRIYRVLLSISRRRDGNLLDQALAEIDSAMPALRFDDQVTTTIIRVGDSVHLVADGLLDLQLRDRSVLPNFFHARDGPYRARLRNEEPDCGCGTRNGRRAERFAHTE